LGYLEIGLHNYFLWDYLNLMTQIAGLEG
jgi:hypothetical protein